MKHHPQRLFLLVGCIACAIAVSWLTGTSEGEDSPVRVSPPPPGSTAVICRAEEPGVRLLISGRVQNTAGAPIAGAVVTVYNADTAGLYNPPNAGTREPRIRGTVQTDDQGCFQVLTVRPGPYPNATEPAHVHMDVTAASYRLKHQTFWFDGDPLVTPKKIEQAREYERAHPDDIAVITPVNDSKGVLMVTQVVTLEGN